MKLNGLNRTIRFTQNLGGSYAGLFTGASFIADFMGDDQMKAGGVTATFIRATIATVTDQDLVVREVLIGERRKGGFRRVRNLVSTKSEDNTVGATTTANVTIGTTTIAFTSANASYYYKNLNASSPVGAVIRVRGEISCTVNRTVLVRLTDAIGFDTRTNLAVTATPQVFSSTVTVSSAGVVTFGIDNRAAVSASDTSTTGVFTFTKLQFEDVTGQSNQNPAEYVSVGVLASPYQGANVDGVQYFNYLNGNTVASNVVTEAAGPSINGNSNFGALPGVAGDYFSTPDSPAASITGDIDIRVKIALNDWTPATDQVLVAKMTGAGTRSYRFYVNSSTPGQLTWQWTVDGTTQITVFSSIVAPFADLTAGWLRVTFDVDNGAAGSTATFYTSQDGVTWTQLGTPQITAGVTSIADTTAVLEIGTFAAGTNGPATGKFYRAQIYNGINGTLAVDFNPNSWTSGANWTSATGEVWTINNNARVVPVYLGGYLSELAATDLLLARADARDMTTANWTLGATLTRARTSVGADGVANKATRLTGGVASATNIITTTIVAAAASRTYSVLIKRVAGTNAIRLTQDNFATTFEVTALINSSTYTLVQMEQSQLNPVFGIQVGGTGDAIDVDWNQYQTGNLTGLVNSRIPDTITTRNADVLTYATTGWLNAAAGTLYAEWFNPAGLTPSDIASVNDNSTNNVIRIYADTGFTKTNAQVVVAGVTQSLLNTPVVSTNAVAKAVNIYQANDFAGYVNNTSLGADAAGTIPTVTQLQIGTIAGANQLGHYIRKVAYFPYRMNSAIAQRLTV